MQSYYVFSVYMLAFVYGDESQDKIYYDDESNEYDAGRKDPYSIDSTDEYPENKECTYGIEEDDKEAESETKDSCVESEAEDPGVESESDDSGVESESDDSGAESESDDSSAESSRLGSIKRFFGFGTADERDQTDENNGTNIGSTGRSFGNTNPQSGPNTQLNHRDGDLQENGSKDSCFEQRNRGMNSDGYNEARPCLDAYAQPDNDAKKNDKYHDVNIDDNQNSADDGGNDSKKDDKYHDVKTDDNQNSADSGGNDPDYNSEASENDVNKEGGDNNTKDKDEDENSD